MRCSSWFVWSLCLSFACQGAIGPGGVAEGAPPAIGPGARPPEDPDRPASSACDAFEAAPASSAAAKVKNLLTGLALSAEELQQVQADPDALRALVHEWLRTPEASHKLRVFFSMAFQQEGFAEGGLSEQWGEPDLRGGFFADDTETNLERAWRENFETSFGRTALQLVQEGRPFREVATTRRFMMTTAMLVTMAHQDDRHRNDLGQSFWRRSGSVLQTVYHQNRQRLDALEIVNPSSPNFLRFYAESERIVPPCSGGSVSYSERNAPIFVFRAMFGYFARFSFDSSVCASRAEPNFPAPALLRTEDFNDWRLVEVRQPEPGEAPTRFYDLGALRDARELVAHTPRVGFFTTPAFFALWQTNADNAHRVTANQALITALGQSIDDEQSIAPTRDDALDGAHADPTTGCWGCHRILDPMRQIFRQEYTIFANEQLDDAQRAIPSSFGWGTVSAEPNTIFEYADVLANHPQLPRAWVQKMCFYANSAACPEGELLDQVVERFEASDLDFLAMVEDLFSSALVTSMTCVERGTGDNASIARARHFCAALGNRVGIEDICGRETIFASRRTTLRDANAALVSTVPDDVFSRGAELPLTVSDVNLFVRATYERICANTADALIGEGRRYSAGSADDALDFFVAELMGLSSADPRHGAARAILAAHYEEAQTRAADAEVALQSAFTLACLSPSLMGMGL